MPTCSGVLLNEYQMTKWGGRLFFLLARSYSSPVICQLDHFFSSRVAGRFLGAESIHIFLVRIPSSYLEDKGVVSVVRNMIYMR